MLQSSAQPHDWLYGEPLIFDDDFCQSLMKDLQALPTPPQSPPMKAGLSKEDQLSYVSNILLEDADMKINWTCDFFHSGGDGKAGGSGPPGAPLEEEEEEVCEDALWRCLTTEEKLVSSMLGSSPLLSDIDTSIFEEIAGSTLDCQNLLEAQEPGESDGGSTGGELSTSSDSDEEIDVVTVSRCPASPSLHASARRRRRREEEEEEEQRALQRHHHYDIHLQHNYAAPLPASPPPSTKRWRGGDSSRGGAASSSSGRYQQASRGSVETEDEEERRRTHNVMERQRRNELKNCFLRLRDHVPELSHNDKASKVVILKKARDCISGLEEQARRLQARRDRLRSRQEELKARLQRLRS